MLRLYIFVVGLAIQVARLDALSFIAQPQSLDVIEGQRVTLPCSADETDVVFSWTLNGQNVDSIQGISIQDGNLVISSVDRDDHSGEFRCVVSSPSADQPITSQPASLNILWISAAAKLSLKTPSDPGDIAENSKVTMICKADGFDKPEYTFYRDSTELGTGTNIAINDKSLKILSVRTSDNGVYSCKATNRAGEVWSTRGNVTINIRGSDYPTVVTAPKNEMVFEGDTVSFHCEFSGTPTPPVEWYIGEDEGGLLYNLTGTTSIYPNGTLVLQNIQIRDEGTYTCLCKSEHGEPSVSAQLQVARVEPLPPFDAVIVKEGDQLTSRCEYPQGTAGGIPAPELVWSKAGTELSTDEGDRVHVTDGRLLYIDNIQKSDEGNYTCTASNTAGEVKSFLYITVATKPVFTIRPMNVTVKEQETAMLDCQAEADPKPKIQWIWNGKAMYQDQFTRILDNGTLVFYSTTIQNDGTYSCKASNIVGSESEATAELTVQAILKFNPNPVGSTQFELGDVEKLNCHAVAETTPTVTWMKGKEIISVEDKRITAENGLLVFNGAIKSDAGSYTCIARTDEEEINATIKVEVFVKPKFTVIPKNITVHEGDDVILDCEAYGDPQPEINWIKASKRWQPIKMSNNSLYIEDVTLEDEGKYSCVAGSLGGLNTTDVFVTVSRGGVAPASHEVMTRTFAIAVGCALAYILLFIFLMIWCKQRRRKRRMTLKEDGSKEEGPLANGLGEYHDEEANKGDMALTSAAVQATRANYDKLQFPRHDLETIAVIGHGAYGEVSIARAQGIRDGEDATTVLVKALETKDDNLHLNFRGEIDMLSKLNHENIVKLLGICKEAEPQLMLTEYLDWGDLKQFLRATRGEEKSPNNPPPLTYNQKIDIINQVALGMEHLSNNRFVHADLAARNCLLSPSMEVKICTMSASKDLYRSEYHEYQNRLMPVRWMPPEAIFEDELSTKSDIWSFGVFIWEVFSQGELPYGEVDDDAYMSAIVDGDLALKTPGGTPEEVENTMQRCWASSIKDRPSFSDLVIAMQQLNSDSTM